jgi:predicted Zn finger-like uncharacterized protein
MLIVCPSCTASYDLEAASLPFQGCQVRCLRCGTVWRAELSQADKLFAAAVAIAPDHGMVKVAADAVAEAAIPAAPELASEGALSDPSAGEAIATDMGTEKAADALAEAPLPVAEFAEMASEGALSDPSADAVVAPGIDTENAADALAEAALPAAELLAEVASEGALSDLSAGEPHGDEQWADEGSLATANDDDDRASAVDRAAEGIIFGEPDHSGEGDAPPIVPVDFSEDEPPADFDNDRSIEHRTEHIEIAASWRPQRSVAARRQQRNVTRRWTPRWPVSPLHAGIIVLVLVDIFLIGWRGDIVRALPQTAAFYALTGLPVNLRGLAFDGIVATTEQQDGEPILVVEGNIVNTTHKVARVPRLKFAMRNGASREIYSWSAFPMRTSLPPGETVAFRTRIASPPSEARDLVLRFVTRRDVIAALR